LWLLITLLVSSMFFPFLLAILLSVPLYFCGFKDRWYVLNEERTGDMSWMRKGPMICLEWGKDRWYVLNEERTGDMSWMRKGPVIIKYGQSRIDNSFANNSKTFMTTDISVCRNQNPVLSSVKTYHRSFPHSRHITGPFLK
jgi:hypothetical protein